MTGILMKIVDSKVRYIDACKRKISEKDMKSAALISKQVPSFKKAMAKEELSIIGEIKKASPSRGIIDPDFDCMSVAGEYERCVDAISILTETDYFMGRPEYIEDVAGIVTKPILRKDFIIDSYQIFEARRLGASCVLLIAAILDSAKLKAFIELSTALGMDSLVEVHDECELYRGLRAGAELIGVNNRNLKDFSIDLRMTRKLGALIPKDVLLIGESGIKNEMDALLMKKAGADGILVGESFMKSSDKIGLAKVFRNAC